jgi:arylsulfatase A-like enzyme
MNLRRALLVVALSTLPACRGADAPNFIFILADDLGWTSLSQPMDDRRPAARSDYQETPALERLASCGMRFTQGYAPDALCCPSRRSLQFGQTPTRQGDERFPKNYGAGQPVRLTIPRMLKAVDPRYRTAHYGLVGPALQSLSQRSRLRRERRQHRQQERRVIEWRWAGDN